ncbi:unnamed protein product [Rotaria magnacalcarata]|uniref:Uncharacterized protein n=2 Tax=Rotaria magnacalcarata TaxID=392030 RepID=A0A815FG57_9BILA|nr:unnamed protein product [Rotaria magnacalcarata]CAF2148225.1 unnamed protein product [Rotaria magnacalcarata]CAF3859883.1 unnamed protein product [Rotaria magnacalcarata]CAF3909636.1 unnamed protein product [Rotaria magnacalcarata]CAF3974602.1 unnamed protein product [Rotaria magnacalcarata]
MTDTLLLLSSTMSNDRQRIRQLKYHINQLLSELRMIESNNNIQPLNISINSQLTTLSHGENFCPYVSCKQKPAILHSTTNNEYRKKTKKFLFAASARATSTPKSSPNHNRMMLKPHHTSTPRRNNKRHSTPLAAMPTNNMIPLKRLLYNKDYDQHKRRHSAVPFSKRSILPRLQPIDENPQWI